MADKPNHPDLAAIVDAHDDVTRPRAFRAAQARAAAEVELTEADAVAVNPAADGPVQAQGMIRDTIDKAMEEFAEHVQPKINDAIDEAMDMAFGEDGTDGNGNTDDDAGGSDDSGDGTGESGGSEGGESGGSSATSAPSPHLPSFSSGQDTRMDSLGVHYEPLTSLAESPDGVGPVGLELPEIDDLNL